MESLKEFLEIHNLSTYILYDKNRMPVAESLAKELDFDDVTVLKHEIKDGKYYLYTDIYLGGC